MSVFQSQDKVRPGTDLELAVRLRIESGWHINSDIPNEDYLVASSLEIHEESPFGLSEVRFPDPLELNLPFSSIPMSLFEGEILIGAVLNIPEDTTLGEHKLSLGFLYQACNRANCLPPETTVQEITLCVVDESTPVEKIHREIFERLRDL